MTLEDDIYTICSGDTGLTNLVSDRIYLSREPASPTYPHVVYTSPITVDNTGYRDHDGAAGRYRAVVQFDCYGNTANEAGDVADQLADLWDGYQSSSPDIGYAFLDDRINDGYQPGLDAYRVIVDITLETGV
jgi:hypothetical protein